MCHSHAYTGSHIPQHQGGAAVCVIPNVFHYDARTYSCVILMHIQARIFPNTKEVLLFVGSRVKQQALDHEVRGVDA
jgi:hypothetical protein